MAERVQKPKSKLAISVILGVFLVLLLCCVGTTFGYVLPRVRVFNYLSKISPPIDATNKAVKIFDRFEKETDMPERITEDEQSVKQYKKGVQDLKQTIQAMRKEIDKGRAVAQKVQPPAPATTVHGEILSLLKSSSDNLKELEEDSNYLITFTDSLLVLAKVMPEMKKEPPKDDPQALINYLQNIKSQLDEAQKILEAQPPPALFSDLNQDFIVELRTLSEAYGLLIEGIQTSDSAKIDEADRKLAAVDQLKPQLDKDDEQAREKLSKIAKAEERQVDRANRELTRLRRKYIPFYKVIFE